MRWSARLLIVIAGSVVTGAGVLVLLAGLEDADKISSVVGAVAGVLGLAVSIAGALRARGSQENSASAAPASSDGVEAKPAVRDVSMLAEAAGDARIYQAGGDMTVNDR